MCCVGINTVYATEISESIETEKVQTVSTVVMNEGGYYDLPASITVTLVDGVYSFMDGETLLFDSDSEEYEIFLNYFEELTVEDAVEGLSALYTSNVTLDHVALNETGEFLSNYYGKSLTSFPIGEIEIDMGDYEFGLVNNTASKTFIIEVLSQNMLNAVVEEAEKYPVQRYLLSIPSGCLLMEYEFNNSDVVPYKTYYPLEGIDTFIVYNTGNYYALSLSSSYIGVLRGYIEGEKSGYDRPVDAEIPGCVNILAPITLLRNLEGGTLSDKSVSDFMLYDNLYVTLDTKQLVLPEDSSLEKSYNYVDYKLDETKLILKPVVDGIVIIQPIHLECIMYAGFNLGINRYVDVSKFVTTDEPVFELYHNGVMEEEVSIDSFTDSLGLLTISVGNSNFLMYRDDVPYAHMIYWAYNESGDRLSADGAFDTVIDSLQAGLKAEGREADFDTYLTAAGQVTGTVKTLAAVLVVFVLLLILALVVLRIRKKNRVTISDTALFTDDYDYVPTANGSDTDFEFK